MAIQRAENERFGPLMAKKILDRINTRKPVTEEIIKEIDEQLRKENGI